LQMAMRSSNPRLTPSEASDSYSGPPYYGSTR